MAAIVLIAHGIGHTIGFLGPWFGVYQGTADKPWILPGNQPLNSPVGRAWGAIWFVAMVLFIGSGIGVFMEETWWRALAIVGSVVSTVAPDSLAHGPRRLEVTEKSLNMLAA